jgi:hypothetical protein
LHFSSVKRVEQHGQYRQGSSLRLGAGADAGTGSKRSDFILFYSIAAGVPTATKDAVGRRKPPLAGRTGERPDPLQRKPRRPSRQIASQRKNGNQWKTYTGGVAQVRVPAESNHADVCLQPIGVRFPAARPFGEATMEPQKEPERSLEARLCPFR